MRTLSRGGAAILRSGREFKSKTWIQGTDTMDFELSKAQLLLQDSARKLFQRSSSAEKVREIMATPTAYDAPLWSEMADQGWLGMTLPESCGGLGMGLVDLAAVAEEMGRACLPGPFLSNFWASSLLLEAAGENAGLLESIAEGKTIATVAYLEEGNDWCPDSITMRAEKKGSDIVLTGCKAYVGDADVAALHLVAVRLGDDLAVVAVDRKSKGIEVTLTPAIDETRKLYEVRFTEVAVPADRILAIGGKARTACERAMAAATCVVCAESVGVMQWILETSVEYAKARQQFDRAIGSFQAVQHQCADMLTLTESARSAAYYAAWSLMENEADWPAAVATAKAYISDAVREVGNKGCQVHGGIGFTWEHDLHLYYKRAKSNEIIFGDASYHRENVARSILA
jgi:alkylation response protein AidB-like acyl-CoA dehydrogenase